MWKDYNSVLANNPCFVPNVTYSPLLNKSHLNRMVVEERKYGD